MDNKTETLEGQDWIVEVEDVRNISVIEIVCAVSPLAVRRRGGTIICLIFPRCGVEAGMSGTDIIMIHILNIYTETK